jgi:hypothetical protein
MNIGKLQTALNLSFFLSLSLSLSLCFSRTHRKSNIVCSNLCSNRKPKQQKESSGTLHVKCEVSLPHRSLTAKRCCTKHKRKMSALRIEKLLSKSIRPYYYQAELSDTKVLRIAPLQLHKQKAAILVCVKITTNKVHCCIADASPTHFAHKNSSLLRQGTA